MLAVAKLAQTEMIAVGLLVLSTPVRFLRQEKEEDFVIIQETSFSASKTLQLGSARARLRNGNNFLSVAGINVI